MDLFLAYLLGSLLLGMLIRRFVAVAIPLVVVPALYLGPQLELWGQPPSPGESWVGLMVVFTLVVCGSVAAGVVLGRATFGARRPRSSPDRSSGS